VDSRPALSGLAVTGGRANAGAAFRMLAETDPTRSGLAFVDTATPAAPVGPAAPGGPDSDRDGRGDAADACPAKAARTRNGCPLPRVRSLSVKVSPRRCRRGHACRRTASVAVAGDPAATVRLTIESRRCVRGGCRWVPVAKRSLSIAGGTATVRIRSRRLVRGLHRATAVLSSSLGSGEPRSASFRIR
jgi:hypothetical protein